MQGRRRNIMEVPRGGVLLHEVRKERHSPVIGARKCA